MNCTRGKIDFPFCKCFFQFATAGILHRTDTLASKFNFLNECVCPHLDVAALSGWMKVCGSCTATASIFDEELIIAAALLYLAIEVGIPRNSQLLACGKNRF